MKIHLPALVLSVLVASASGCADADGGQPADTAPPADLSDPQIAHVAVTANEIDIELARLAERRSSDEAVLGFARTMINDHTAVNELASELAGRLGVTPEDNDVSQSLRADAAEARAELDQMQGAEFDRAYMEREVSYHQAVLDALDATLIPGADNEELRGLLEQVRPAIAAHLQHATTLRDSSVARR